MAGCNDACNCYIAADLVAGTDVDGLGSADEPYVITTADGFHIPQSGTSVDRLALDVDNDNQGLVFFETDTGIAYIYDGTTYGWRKLSVTAIEAAAASTTLSSGVGVLQTIAQVSIAAGVWAITAKVEIEAAVSAGTGWDAVLMAGASELDHTQAAISGGEVGAGVATYYRALPLQRLYTAAAVTTIDLQVNRATTAGTQVVRFARLMAWSIPGNRP